MSTSTNQKTPEEITMDMTDIKKELFKLHMSALSINEALEANEYINKLCKLHHERETACVAVCK